MVFLSENSNVHHYSNFENYWLRIGTDTLEDILLKIFGGRPCNSVYGIALLWVSVGQRASELPANKVGGLKKKSADRPARVKRVRTGLIGRIFFRPSTLIAGSSDAL